MPRLRIETDDGRLVQELAAPDEYALHNLIQPCGHEGVRRLTSALHRGLGDAYRIERGEDPERASEKAMRLSAEAPLHAPLHAPMRSAGVEALREARAARARGPMQ